MRGLEWVAAAEAESVAGSAQIALAHRSLFLEGERVLDPCDLRCPDDVFLFWAQLSSLDHTRQTLANLREVASKLPAVPMDIAGFRGLHVTASFLGRRNYLRNEIEQAIGEALASRLNLKWHAEMPSASGILRARIHLAGESAVLGVGITGMPMHRRSWRVHTLPGMLHPSVAASIAFLAELREGIAVCDPFAGSGTILIESGLRQLQIGLTGWDVSPKAIAAAKDHAARAGVEIDLQVRDAFVAGDSKFQVDRVLSNPPWGISVHKAGQPDGDPFDILSGLLKQDGLLVAIADKSMDAAACCRRAKLKPVIIFSVRLAGRIAEIVVAGRTSQDLASPLKRYWTAMKKIPWEGDDGQGALGVPRGWGKAIRIS